MERLGDLLSQGVGVPAVLVLGRYGLGLSGFVHEDIEHVGGLKSLLLLQSPTKRIAHLVAERPGVDHLPVAVKVNACEVVPERVAVRELSN